MVAVRLEVQALARRVGRDEDAQRVFLRWRVEGVAKTFPVLLFRKTSIDLDTFFVGVRIRHNSLDLGLQIAQRIFPLGEDEHAPVGPLPVLEAICPNPLGKFFDPRVRKMARTLRKFRHPIQQCALSGVQQFTALIAQRDARVAPHCRRRDCFNPEIVVALHFLWVEFRPVIIGIRR